MNLASNLCISLFVLLNLNVYATEVSRSQPNPQIKILKSLYNLGDVFQNEKKSFELEIDNAGQRDLIIKKMQAACGCTEVKLAQNSIVPGGSLKANVLVTFKERVGPFVKKIAISSNDPGQPVIFVTVQANVKQLFHIDPPELDFGSVPVGTKLTRTVQIKWNRILPGATISKVAFDSSYFTGTLLKKDNSRYDMNVTFQPKVCSEITATLAVTIKYEKGEKKLHIPVRGRGYRNVLVEPSRVFFGLVKLQHSVTQVITINIPDSQDHYELVLPEKALPGLSILIDTPKKYEYKIRLTWKPVDQEKIQYTLPIVLLKNKTQVDTINLPCLGFVNN